MLLSIFLILQDFRYLPRFFSVSGHTAEVQSVCLSASNEIALSGGADMMLRLWKVNTGECLVVS
jgi:WD40 repeat protein